MLQSNWVGRFVFGLCVFAAWPFSQALAASSHPANLAVLHDRVDLIELNHLHDNQGQPTLDQLIFYNWSSQRRRFDVVAWRLVKGEHMHPLARYPEGRRYYLVRFHDDGILREIRSSILRETWTLHDPELRERDYLEQDSRVGLRSCRPTESLCLD